MDIYTRSHSDRTPHPFLPYRPIKSVDRAPVCQPCAVLVKVKGFQSAISTPATRFTHPTVDIQLYKYLLFIFYSDYNIDDIVG